LPSKFFAIPSDKLKNTRSYFQLGGVGLFFSGEAAIMTTKMKTGVQKKKRDRKAAKWVGKKGGGIVVGGEGEGPIKSGNKMRAVGCHILLNEKERPGGRRGGWVKGHRNSKE